MAFFPDSRSIRPQAPLTSAEEFLTRGKLPFVGREHELATLLAFWRETPHSDELRLCLLSGEAGIGKSRLIEKLTSKVEARGGAVIHTRVYPESTFSLFSAIPSAIAASGSVREVLTGEIQGELSTVAAALRRVARLRATIIIIEDFQLLGEHARRELNLLLGALREERLSVLVAARPVETVDRSVLEHYLTNELTLKGLDKGELQHLWSRLFAETPSDGVLEILNVVLGGNPLAARAALRGMLRTLDTKTGSPSRSSIECTVELHRHLSKSAANAIEGFVSHLTSDDLHAAGQIACLGEVFARETALAMCSGEAGPLDRLIEQGIIATAKHPPTPLPRRVLEYTQDDYPPGAYPALGFVHSLVHRHLLASAAVDASMLVSIVATDLPLYSYLPFRLIERHPTEPACNSDDVFSACDRAFQSAVEAAQQATLGERVDILRSHQHFIQSFQTGMATEHSHRLRASELAVELCLLDYLNHPNPRSYFPIVEELLELTSGECTNGESELRLLALIWQCLLDEHCNDRYPEERLASIERFVRSRPELEATAWYWRFLEMHVNAMRLRADSLGVAAERLAEEALKRIIASSLHDGVKDRAWQTISPVLIDAFTMQDEMERRLRLAHDLLSSPLLPDINRLNISSKLCVLLYNVGYIEEANQIRIDVLKTLKERGMQLQVVWHSAGDACSRALLGLDPTMFEAATADILASVPPGAGGVGIRAIDAMVLESAILCGAREHARRIFERSCDDLYFRKRMDLCSFVTISNGIENLRSLVVEQASLVPEFDGAGPVISWLLGREPIDIAGVRDELTLMISANTFVISDIRQACAGIDLVEFISAMPAYGNFVESFAPLIRTTLLKCLEWLSDPRRSLFRLMTALLNRYGDYLSQPECTYWIDRAEKFRLAFDERSRPAAPTCSVRISMLGTITIQGPGTEPQRLRGVRAQALLATLVADRMLDCPLQLKELWQIVAGSDDPDKARIVTNTTIHRLREFLGHEAILTTTTGSGGSSGEPPRLDMNLVEVDLIEANRLVAEAVEGVRNRTLMRVVPALCRALAIIGGEVPFPGLYDDFFEAARTDFECRLRDAVVDVSRALLRENDAAGAAMILRSAFNAMPDDEEIGELLGKTLVLLDRRTEAERVRMRVKGETSA